MHAHNTHTHMCTQYTRHTYMHVYTHHTHTHVHMHDNMHTVNAHNTCACICMTYTCVYIDENTQLVESFQEINRFYEKNNREPEKSGNIIEAKLFFRLDNLKKDIQKREYLSNMINTIF